MYDKMWEITIDETYAKALPTLERYAFKFHNMYGGDYDDYFSQACFWFVKTYPKWKPEISDYVTYLSNMLNWNLRNIKRNRTQKHLDRYIPMSQLDTEECVFDPTYKKHTDIDIINLLDELSSEAKIVVDSLLELVWLDDNSIVEGPTTWYSIKKELTTFLLNDLCWTKQEIVNTFKEIGNAL